jgi:hypothetical protein
MARYKVRIYLEFDNKPTDVDIMEYLRELIDCDTFHYELVDMKETK